MHHLKAKFKILHLNGKENKKTKIQTPKETKIKLFDFLLVMCRFEGEKNLKPKEKKNILCKTSTGKKCKRRWDQKNYTNLSVHTLSKCGM